MMKVKVMMKTKAQRDNEQRDTMKGETRDSTTGLVYGLLSDDKKQ
jgi:hypothetical protein